MTALKPCPECDGNDRDCWACNGAGQVPVWSVDLNDELITFDGCGCDMDQPCNDATCQMDRDLEMRRMFALYRRGALTPPRDIYESLFAEQMVDAGRAHLLTDAQKVLGGA